MLLFQKAGSCWLPPSLACDLWRSVCPSSSPPTNWRDFSQQLTHTDTHTNTQKGKIRKWKEVGGSWKSNEEDRWKHPETDGGHREGQTCWIWRRAKALKKTLEKSTLDAKGETHSTLNSRGHMCQFKLCVREKWKHKEVKIKCKKSKRRRYNVSPGWCCLHTGSGIKNKEKQHYHSWLQRESISDSLLIILFMNTWIFVPHLFPALLTSF